MADPSVELGTPDPMELDNVASLDGFSYSYCDIDVGARRM